MLLLFVLVSLISFAGSIHPGIVNLAVIQTTLSQSPKAGVWLALGGSLPEIGYSALAAGGLMLLPANATLQTLLTYAPIPILFGAGISAFRQEPVSLTGALVADNSPSLPFWKGFSLASTNPQLLPFWSAVWLYLSDQMLIPSGQWMSRLVFSLGTAAGAFGVLVLFVWLANRQRQRILYHLNGRWINYLTGAAFVGMALWQTVQIMIREF